MSDIVVIENLGSVRNPNGSLTLKRRCNGCGEDCSFTFFEG